MKNFFVILILFCIACSPPQNKSNEALEKILTYQDNRAAADSLYPFLRNSDPSIRLRAVMALGQMQDTTAVDSLAFLAKAVSVNMSQTAIFALGQIGFASGSLSAQSRIETVLIDLFEDMNAPQVRSIILEALGKTGSERSFDPIQKTLNDTSVLISKEASMACARLAIRDIRSEKTDSCLVVNLNHRKTDVRRASVYAIMRIHNKKTAPSVLPMLKDDDEQVRMDAARALGSMKLTDKDPDYKEIVQALVVSAFNDTDWRVRVNAVNALGNFKFKQDDLKKIYFLIAFEGKKDPNIHVRISAIRAMTKSYSGDISDVEGFLNNFSERFLPKAEYQEQGELIIALCQMFGEKILSHRSMTTQINNLSISSDGYLRSRIVEALGYTSSLLAMPYLEKALQDSFGLVQNNALEALSKIKDPQAENLIIQSLETRDLTLLSIAAGILSSNEAIKKDDKKREMLSQKIVNAFGDIKPPIDVEAQMAVFDALGEFKSASSTPFLRTFLADSDRVVVKSAARNIEKITGEKPAFNESVLQRKNPVDFAFFLKIKSKKPTAVIETGKGRIDIEFNVDEAPLTVINFIKLSEKKFFDDLHFHRVVPNFVIQGGDPLGTGWGGPGYSIRSEFSQLHYDRGVLGMASAGKDTEGCQWFITHSAQPHLDGRYTIFGKVRQGMDVVDAIQVGDTISKIKIIWH